MIERFIPGLTMVGRGGRQGRGSAVAFRAAYASRTHGTNKVLFLSIKLGPFKMEELNQDPFIVSFKDFLYHEEIETLKSLAANNLKLSRVGLRDNAKKDTDLR